MRNLKRFRSWIALVVATSWNYLRQLGTKKSTTAEDRPENAKPQASNSARIAAESESKAPPKPVPPIQAKSAPRPIAAPIESKPAPKPVAAPIESKPAPKPVAAPTIESKPPTKPVPAPPVAAESAPKASPVATSKAAVPAKPAVQVTVEAGPANGKSRATAMNEQSAQRLARVLISEIKLYYMSKIQGQNEAEMRNIYDLLKDPIDKSRQHYNQRVGTETSLPDYFHGELVKTLCAGDESRLGPNYSAK